MKKITFIIVLLMATFGFSQTEPKGVELVDSEKIVHISTNKSFGEILKDKDEEGTLRFLVETMKEPKFIYNLATNIPIVKKSYTKGRVFLLTFKAKTEKSSLETGEAKILWLFKQTNSYMNNLAHTQSISSEWQTYYVPFEANVDIDEKDIAIVMQYGYKPQSFYIKDISFQEYPVGTKFESLPRTKIKYAGMEADADWRKAANDRIEKIRKGTFSLEVTKNGKPVQGKEFTIQLKRHSFPFGAAINAKDVVNNTLEYQNFKANFTEAVFENDLKIKSWSNPKNKERTLKAIEILKKDNIAIKGHVLIWPGFQYLTPEVEENQDNPEKVVKIVKEHVNSVLDDTQDNISHWDVVNECYTNKDLQRITGSEEILYEGFRLAKAKQPNAKRFINEYGIISKGGMDTKKQKWYYDFIKRIDDNTGGLLDGIGIQCHIGSDLTPPEKVLEILNYYASLRKKISISEFTMDIQEPEIRAQYTKDFMIAMFSHPSVTEFLFWGCTENEKRKVDIFKPDGSVGVMGNAYMSLMQNEWNTNVTDKTNNKGVINVNGFYGTYIYTFKENGKEYSGVFSYTSDGPSIFKINL